MMACVWAVEVGLEPTVACSYQAPCGINDFRYGQSLGQRRSTSRPPASQTIVTINFGAFVLPATASTIGDPSIAVNGKWSSWACVGAIPASVTGRWTTPAGAM